MWWLRGEVVVVVFEVVAMVVVGVTAICENQHTDQLKKTYLLCRMALRERRRT